ncbi:crossover junction endodeoxyribonuclease RuvC [Desulfovirgula thermocuniculi]|uniref:crossover junction endodeoxyribonuclease RuvC n=1 Tax=Desulfovirgula thermocuniculi TaxID=348842 RepID=UPI0003FCF4EF|nr:crossover junction endodeoxyribonuclease RuvC [Desulfovirgula thermocuniculi]
MRVMGVDPGVAVTGYGVVELENGRLTALAYDVIKTNAGVDLPERLRLLYERVLALLERYRPQWLALEELFFSRNARTAFSVGQARGVVLLAAAVRGLGVASYTPLEVKQAVAGYGRASKAQVQYMVRAILNLPSTPHPDDVADALAVAICHAHRLGGFW